MKLPEFENAIFDAALQMECMSSEESDMEDGARSSTTLRTRGYAWRSRRLLRLYRILDVEEMSDKSTKPRRGVGKRHRVQGPFKDGDLLPPAGIATWMISRRWVKVTSVSHPDLPEALERLVVARDAAHDSARLSVLGEDSEVSDEFDNHASSPVEQVGYAQLESYQFPAQSSSLSMEMYPEHCFTSSSLQNALTADFFSF